MIVKYEVVNPVTNRKRPYLDNKDYLIVPNAIKDYKYYIECRQYNPKDLCYNYYLLLGVEKFDENCRKCNVDDYCRLKCKLHGETLNFIKAQYLANGNNVCNYLESEDNYDVFIIY